MNVSEAPANKSNSNSSATDGADPPVAISPRPKPSFKLIRYPIFLVALALTGGILILNHWIDAESLPWLPRT